MGMEFNDCGCCQSIKELTRAEIENPLGLSSLKYRIGNGTADLRQVCIPVFH